MSDRCKTCNARIVWATNPETGKSAPYDAMPAGVGFELRDGDKPWTGGQREGPLTMGPKRTVYVSHFATCIHADRHRKAR